MRIVEETGAIDVQGVEGGVTIEQQSTNGEAPSSVFIPTLLIDAVVKAMRQESASA